HANRDHVQPMIQVLPKRSAAHFRAQVAVGGGDQADVEFERVGGTHTLKLDVRLIAATNRDLGAEVRRGAFREDLYQRLNVVAIRVPPLRERTEDIPALARHFLERAAARCGRRVTAISAEAESYLIGYSWPGNIRELENAI